VLENGEQLDGRGQLVLDYVERAALSIAVVRVDPRAHDELALVGLAHVHVHGVRHHDALQHRLEQRRHERLQRVGLDR
jgi:hypothetical protein